jgi:hypothetical protein
MLRKRPTWTKFAEINDIPNPKTVIGVEHMDFRRLLEFSIVGLLCIAIGYFAGREHLKYEMRTALGSVAQGMKQSLQSKLGGAGPSTQRAASPSAPKLTKPFDVALLNKGFEASDPRSRNYQDLITFSIEFTNLTGKNIRAFDGALTFTDILDNEIYGAKLAITDPVSAGAKFTWRGQLNYNQFIDAHRKLRNESAENLKIIFSPKKLLFSDGTTKNYGE